MHQHDIGVYGPVIIQATDLRDVQRSRRHLDAEIRQFGQRMIDDPHPLGRERLRPAFAVHPSHKGGEK